MNEVMTNILTRRTIRRFSAQQIPENELAQIITAAKFAPSAMNTQTWHFTVIQNQELIAMISAVNRIKLDADYVSTVRERMGNREFCNFYHAPTVIIISTEDVPFGVADAANAAENICLAAHSFQIGSCYIASFLPAFAGDEGPRLRAALQLPDHQIPRFAVALGYPQGELPAASARKENNVTFLG